MGTVDLGLDELMIINPSPVGAHPRVLVPQRFARVVCRARTPRAIAIRASPSVLLGDDGTVYRAIARITRPAYEQDPVAGTYQVI
jgi:hypothetical protein